MTEAKIQIIRGGWKNVPEGWHTKTQLNKMGLKPIGEPVGEVYSGREWRKLYDVKETKEKRKPSEKQLAALEKARKKKEEIQRQIEEENRRYELEQYEREMKEKEEYLRQYGFDTFGTWFETNFVILDTETTSLNGEIVDIAIIDRNGNVLFNSLVKPKFSIDQEAYNVHGISNEMVSNAPTWPEVYEEVRKVLKDRLVLIYNDSFDYSILCNTCGIWDLKMIDFRSECVMRTYAEFYGYSRWVSLSVAAGTWTSHRALGDCLDTLSVIKEVWKDLGLIQLEEGLKR